MSEAIETVLSQLQLKLKWASALQDVLLLLLLLLVLSLLSHIKTSLMLKVMLPRLCTNLPLQLMIFSGGRELKDGGYSEWCGDVGVWGM
jgi:hypothetical protein